MGRRRTEEEPYAEPMRRRRSRLVGHVHIRARERLGISLTAAEFADVETRCRERRARFVTRLRGGVSLWDVPLRGRWARVLYDHAGEFLVTILPDDARVRPPPRRKEP